MSACDLYRMEEGYAYYDMRTPNVVHNTNLYVISCQSFVGGTQKIHDSVIDINIKQFSDLFSKFLIVGFTSSPQFWMNFV